LQNLKILYAQKSIEYGKQKRASAASYSALAQEAENDIYKLIRHYNRELVTVGDKWDHMASLPGPWGAQWHQWDMPPLSNYSGSGEPRMQLSNEGGNKGILPGFSVYNKDKRFIDLYNTGNGAVYWSSSVSDDWITLSDTAGVIYDEKRIWVTIDWDKVPQGRDVKGVIEISGAGDKYEVNVSVFNPPLPIREQVNGYIESNGTVSMEAEHFTKKTDKEYAAWTIIKGLGRNGKSVTAWPTTVPCNSSTTEIQNNSPMLEYNVYLFTADSITLTFYCIPSFPINENYGCRIAVAFDNETPQIITARRGDRDVMSNLMTMHAKHYIRSEGQYVLKVWMVDPGVVIDKIVINTGGVKDSYMGPPESYFNQPR